MNTRTNKRVLTGITTSGTPHLGNYAGAIAPAVTASLQPNVDAFFFLADYHALIKCEDPLRVAKSRLEIAATWLAAGLDPNRVTFYRQSDIPEIPELCWILTCIAGKGLMNRAHAYKAAVDQNIEKSLEPDDGINMGLFSYPILMTADILMFNANQVPVGRDQIQHLEMARDIAQRFNHQYGDGRDIFTLPQVLIDDNVATLPGLDGRKMSKSYDNTIPLFEGGTKELKAAINRIVTDSLQPGQPKDADNSHLFTIYKAFASAELTSSFKENLIQGMAWGDAKQQLFELIESRLQPMRERYNEYISAPDKIEEILQAGAKKARSISIPFIQEIREAVGLRNYQSITINVPKKSSDKQDKKDDNELKFVSFKDKDNSFKFRVLGADGTQLLLSNGFNDPKIAGGFIGKIKQGISAENIQQSGNDFNLVIEGNLIAALDADLLDQIKSLLIN